MTFLPGAASLVSHARLQAVTSDPAGNLGDWIEMTTPLFTLRPADDDGKRWAKEKLIEGHYLHTAPDPRTRPFCYIVVQRSRRLGCLWFGRPESTCCYRGGLTYGSLKDVKNKRAQFDRWEVLNLSRVWLSPDVQPGGELYGPENLPGFIDRKGIWRSSLASTLIQEALGTIGYDYLRANPPCFVKQPYEIKAVLSYCNTHLHRGVIYRAAGFTLARTNKAGIETWWTPAVAPLLVTQDGCIRMLAKSNPRSKRIRKAKKHRMTLAEIKETAALFERAAKVRTA